MCIYICILLVYPGSFNFTPKEFLTSNQYPSYSLQLLQFIIFEILHGDQCYSFLMTVSSPVCIPLCHQIPYLQRGIMISFSCVESQSLSTDKGWEKYQPSPSVSYPVSILNTCVYQLNPGSCSQICPKSVINFQVSHALLTSILFVSLFA